MFDSIFQDIKYAIQQGNVLTRIIIANTLIFILINLLYVFTFHISAGESSVYTIIERSLSISNNPIHILKNPWSIITHMFLHKGFWHFGWNMLLLYWFGRIVGDFLGDRRVLPIYILAGLSGMVTFMIAMYFLPVAGTGVHYAMGASGAIMGILLCAAMISPDYTLHLLIVGSVKLKYIAAIVIFVDIVGTAGFNNTGGHFAHLGGALFGMIYATYLKNGRDLTEPLQQLFQWFNQKKEAATNPKNEFIKVVHRKSDEEKKEQKPQRSKSEQQMIDEILDKIKKHGMDHLTDEEKDILYNASKK